MFCMGSLCLSIGEMSLQTPFTAVSSMLSVQEPEPKSQSRRNQSQGAQRAQRSARCPGTIGTAGEFDAIGKGTTLNSPPKKGGRSMRRILEQTICIAGNEHDYNLGVRITPVDSTSLRGQNFAVTPASGVAKTVVSCLGVLSLSRRVRRLARSQARTLVRAASNNRS